MLFEQNLIEKLKSDNKDLIRYVQEIQTAYSFSEAQNLFRKLKMAMEQYIRAEESCLYTRCLEEDDDTLETLVRNGEREHSDLRHMLNSLGTLDPSTSEWKEKIHNLKSKLENYSYWENRDLFPVLA